LICDALEPIAAHVFTVGDVELRDDEREWAAVAGFMQVPRNRIRLISQVHGRDIAVLRKASDESWTPPRADGILSDDERVAIAVRVADCAPVLIADPTRRAVAAVHAGWRGTMQGIAGEAVGALQRELDCRPEDLVAAIGPCLGPCCGEMGPEVIEMFRAAGHDASRISRWFQTGPSGRPYFDLWRANREQLEAAGIPPDRIHSADLCSRSYPEVFHSYRAKGSAAGRMLGIIRAR
jgi:YfiH family protein